MPLDVESSNHQHVCYDIENLPDNSPKTIARVCVAFFSFLAKDLALSFPARLALKIVNLAADAALRNLRRGVDMMELLLMRLNFFLLRNKVYVQAEKFRGLQIADLVIEASKYHVNVNFLRDLRKGQVTVASFLCHL